MFYKLVSGQTFFRARIVSWKDKSGTAVTPFGGWLTVESDKAVKIVPGFNYGSINPVFDDSMKENGKPAIGTEIVFMLDSAGRRQHKPTVSMWGYSKHFERMLAWMQATTSLTFRVFRKTQLRDGSWRNEGEVEVWKGTLSELLLLEAKNKLRNLPTFLPKDTLSCATDYHSFKRLAVKDGVKTWENCPDPRLPFDVRSLEPVQTPTPVTKEIEVTEVAEPAPEPFVVEQQELVEA